MIQGGPSKRHRGKGIFATEDIPTSTRLTHEMIVNAVVGFDHSCIPNVSPVRFTSEQVPYRVTLRGIKVGEELVVDYGIHDAKPNPCDCSKCTR